MMKTSISTYSLIRRIKSGQWKLSDVVDFIAELGADAVEFGGLDNTCPPDKRAAERLRRQCEKRGLGISSYTFSANLLQLDEGAMRAEIERVKGCIDVAAVFGVRTVRHDVAWGFPEGYTGRSTFAAALKWLVPAVREAADYARQFKIVTTSENHGFFAQHSRRVEKLIREVDRKNYRTTIDIGNFLCVGENPVGAVRRMAPYARHVHVKDMHVKGAGSDPGEGWFATPRGTFLRGAIIGHGAVDVRACLKIIKEAGYRGYASVEFEGLEDCELGTRIGLENLKRYLKA